MPNDALDYDQIQQKNRELTEKLEQKRREALSQPAPAPVPALLTANEIDSDLRAAARKFADERINNPSEAEYRMIHHAMLIAWEMAVRQSVNYIRRAGIKPGE